VSADHDSAQLRSALVGRLRAYENLRSDRVASAFEAVPREAFVAEFAAENGLAAVYADSPIVVKRDVKGIPISSSSQPAIMAVMLELLDVNQGARVLEIGAGTGYNAALLAQLTGESGSVIAVEVDDDLGDRASAALRSVGSNAVVVVADGRDGWSSGAPYDRIILTASTPEIPKAWRDQLVEHGTLVVPLRGPSVLGWQLVVAFRRAGDVLRSDAVVPGGFMGLRDAGGPAPNLRGDPTSDADAAIRELLEQWGQAGHPVDRLVLTAGFDDDPPAARAIRTTPGGWIAYDWA
jgi:protein-L-isoaspartate(D-aspartate) O-methyltransferase